MPYTRASVHVKSAYFWFILSSGVWNHHRGGQFLWVPSSVVPGFPFIPLVSHMGQKEPHVKPLLWISVFFWMFIWYYLVILLALRCFQKDDFLLCPDFSAVFTRKAALNQLSVITRSGNLFISLNMPMKITQMSFAFSIKLTLIFKREKSIPTYSI